MMLPCRRNIRHITNIVPTWNSKRIKVQSFSRHSSMEDSSNVWNARQKTWEKPIRSTLFHPLFVSTMQCSTRTKETTRKIRSKVSGAVAHGVTMNDDGTAIQVAFQVANATRDDDCDEPKNNYDRILLSTFHAPWLWQYDPAYVHDSSGQHQRSIVSFYQGSSGWKIQFAGLTSSSPFSHPPVGSLHSTAANIYNNKTRSEHIREDETNDSDSFVQITWYNATTNETLQSHYSIPWLYDCRYDDQARQNRQKATKISPCHAVSRTKSPMEFDFQDLTLETICTTTRKETLFQLLHAILKDGAALVRNAPSSSEQEEKATNGSTDKMVVKLANLLAGGISHGHLYGDTFDVVARTNANNIAYTTEALVPHQDLAYYESQPGLQLLHCVANNADTVIGGESTLVDVLAAATHFQTLAPDLFRVLTSVEATFIKQRQNADMVFRGPCITVDSSDNVVGVRWSPPFEGPVCTERAEDFFVAKAAFELMVDNAIPSDRLFGGSLLDEKLQQKLRQYASDYTWEYRLQPGDLLVFNNQRMLHGRRGFTLKANARDGDRHLIGCYTNMEETLNRYRLHRRPRLVEGRLSMRYHHNAGNNSGGD